MPFSLTHVLSNQTDQICHLAFSPEGNVLGVACQDRSLWVWNLRDGGLLWSMANPNSGSHSHEMLPHPKVSFSPNGTILAASLGDGTVRICTRQGKEITRLVNTVGQATDLAFLPSGKYLMTSDTVGSVSFWDVNTWELAWQFDVLSSPSPSNPSDLMAGIDRLWVSPDGHYLALVAPSHLGAVHVYSIDDVKRTVMHVGNEVEHDSAVTGLSFSPDSSLMAVSIYGESRVRTFETVGGLRAKSLYSLDEDMAIAIAFAPNQPLLAVAGGLKGAVSVWDVVSQEMRGQVLSHTKGWGEGSPAWKIGALAFSPSGEFLAVGGMDTPPDLESKQEDYFGPIDWTVKIWRIS